MNVLFVDGLTSFARARRDDLLPEEEAPVFDGVREYFGQPHSEGPLRIAQAPNRVRIDGVEVTPVFREVSVVRPEPETRPGFVQNPVLLIPRIHIIAEYPAVSRPQVVELSWGTYPRDFLAQERDLAPPGEVEAVVSGEGRFELVRFTKSEPTYTWRSRGGTGSGLAAVPTPPEFRAPTLPLLSAAMVVTGVGLALGTRRLWRAIGPSAAIQGPAATILLFGLFAFGSSRQSLLSILPGIRPIVGDGALALNPEEAAAIFAPLHANIYRAFDYTQEREIYDALEASVDGPLLDEVYNDVYRGLVMQEEGGAVSRVKAVLPVTTGIESIGVEADGRTPTFRVNARWRVEGVVYHWGHSHERTNEYAAIYAVAARRGRWRIVQTVPIEQRRIQSETQAASPSGVETATGAGAASQPSPSVRAPAEESPPWPPAR